MSNHTPGLMSTNDLPDEITEEHLLYLDDLRGSGITNMWGAGRYVADEFAIEQEKAKKIVLYWMKTFSARHPRK